MAGAIQPLAGHLLCSFYLGGLLPPSSPNLSETDLIYWQEREESLLTTASPAAVHYFIQGGSAYDYLPVFGALFSIYRIGVGLLLTTPYINSGGRSFLIVTTLPWSRNSHRPGGQPTDGDNDSQPTAH